mgnify:FL=1
MEVRFATRELAKICTSERWMQKELGSQRAKKLKLRLDDLLAAEQMSDLLLMGGKWELLKADRAGQWSARLTGNWRLIVQEESSQPPTVSVVEIVDYH